MSFNLDNTHKSTCQNSFPKKKQLAASIIKASELPGLLCLKEKLLKAKKERFLPDRGILAVCVNPVVFPQLAGALCLTR